MLYTRSKRNFSHSQEQVMWSLWSQGKSLSDIGRAINKHAGSVFCYLQKYGGIKPDPATRSPKTLTLDEREEISRGIAAKQSMRAIARTLGRAPSTITREIQRNGGLAKYRATVADKNAWIRAKRPKECLLKSNPCLQVLVSEKLEENWSPEQIACWLKRTYPADVNRHVSHETIYKTLYIQARKGLKKELRHHLRTKRVMRQSKSFNTKGNPRGGIIDAVSIKDRPINVDSRKVPGHWEGDLICGSNKSYVATLVERSSRLTILVKLPGKRS